MTGGHRANEGDGFLTRYCQGAIVLHSFHWMQVDSFLQHMTQPIKLLLQISLELLLVDNKAAVNALPSKSI